MSVRILEFANWYIYHEQTMVEPTVIFHVADQEILATISRHSSSGRSYYGYWYYYWFVQNDIWIYEITWDGKDSLGNDVLTHSTSED